MIGRMKIREVQENDWPLIKVILSEKYSKKRLKTKSKTEKFIAKDCQGLRIDKKFK